MNGNLIKFFVVLFVSYNPNGTNIMSISNKCYWSKEQNVIDTIVFDNYMRLAILFSKFPIKKLSQLLLLLFINPKTLIIALKVTRQIQDNTK